jgi:hypothetical protein
MSKKISSDFFSNPVYIFWTGGYDSTFRVCQLLVVERVKVQPVYISDPYLDNKKTSNTRRHNHKQEYKTMDNLTKMINKKFPYTKELLLPLIDIDNIKIDDETNKDMVMLQKRKYVRRARCQYGGMAQVTKNLDKHIEMCAEIGGFFHRYVHKKMNCYGKNDKCKYRDLTIMDVKHLPREDKCLKTFSRFVLPLIAYTKKDMYLIAKKHNFDDILNKTWSCWYPRNDKPCGKCVMCRERFVPPKETEHFTDKMIVNQELIINNNNINNNLCVLIIILLVLALLLKFKKYIK